MKNPPVSQDGKKTGRRKAKAAEPAGLESPDAEAARTEKVKTEKSKTGRADDAAVSGPLFLHVIIFTLGMVVAWQLRVSFVFALGVFLLSLFLLIPAFGVLSRTRKRNYLWLLGISLAVGMLWMSVYKETAYELPAEAGDTVTVRGIVTGAAHPDESGKYSFTLRPQSVNDMLFEHGEFMIYGQGERPPTYGDAVIAEGILFTGAANGNPHSFNYAEYLLLQGVTATVSTAYGGSVVVESTEKSFLAYLVVDVRRSLEQALSVLPSDTANMTIGVILGDKAGLTFAQKEVLVQTGVFHAFSVSGMHVAYIYLLGVLLLSPLARILRRRSYSVVRLIVVGAVLLFYGTLTGWVPPVVRACIMLFVVLIAQVFYEKADSYTSIGIAAFICFLQNPLSVFDAGLQISFIAALGIIYIAPRLQGLFGDGGIRNALYVTLGASLASMPLIAYYFNIISLSGMLVSLLTGILTGGVVMLGFISAVLGMFVPFLAEVFIYGAGALMDVIYWFCSLVSAIPGNYIDIGTISVWAVVVFYIILFAYPLICRYGGKAVSLLVPAALILFLAMPFVTEHAGRTSLEGAVLEVTFIDVGQGDAALIVTPDGKRLLLDGGGNMHSPGSVGEHVLIPYLKSRGINSLDMLISSHQDMDHADGLLTVMENMPVDYLVLTSADVDTEMLAAPARERGITVLYGKAGDIFYLADNIVLRILYPYEGEYVGNNDNESSLVCLLSYGEIDFLFTGDIEAQGVERITAMHISADVLKLPHHGSVHSYSEDFYGTVAPALVVAGVGRNNSFGHPAPKITAYFAGANIPFFRTDKHGAVTVYTNGREIEVLTVK